MTMFLAPYTAIADIDGSPLDAGFLFFGEYGKDPELFPVEVFWDADFTVPAAQPIRTRNGYPVRNGSPTKVYLKTAQHSIVIKNRNGAFILVDFKNKGWSADFVVDASGKTQQEVNDLFKVKLDKHLLIEDFGGDITGLNPSDDAIMDGLAVSATTGLPLIIRGKVRITKTVNQPQNSIVYCAGIVFCTDPSDLTDGWMWDVNHGGGVANTTEITRLILSASDSASIATNRNMKGLRVRSPHVRVGTVHTYGCLDGGVEFGSTGYEIFADVVTCNIGAYSTNLGATGFKISTTDCGVQNVITVGYPIGADLGSTNFADNIHVWGFPATTNANEYASKQMLTGVRIGTSARVNYIYVDTPDTALYDTPPADEKGVGLVFYGWESSVGSLFIRVHDQSKEGKIKLIKYKGHRNSIDYMHPRSRFNTGSPIIYDTPDLQWRNDITYSTVATNITNFTFDVGTMLPSGVTQATGTMSIRKQGKLAIIYFYYTIQSVDTSVVGDFKIPLPSGLTVAPGSSAVLTTRSCLTQHPSAAGGVDFATINGSNQILIRQRNVESGAVFNFQNSQLRTGVIELGTTVSISNN